MKAIILSVLIALTFQLSAQVEIVGKAVLELEQNIYHKTFSKKWKKLKQAEWEAKCAKVESLKDLNVLFNEYSDLLAQEVSFSMGNSNAETVYDFAKYLLQVEGTLTTELVANWTDDKRSLWKKELEDYVKKEDDRMEGDRQLKRLQKISRILKDFEINSKLVWEDSKKNAFKNILTGDAKTGMNNTSIDFKDGEQESITEDEYGVRTFRVYFDCEGDAQMAKKVLEEMMASIEASLVETGYKRTNEQDASFTGSLKNVYQFEGQKFSETAKRPTIGIGIKEKTQGVYFEIIEPVFGH